MTDIPQGDLARVRELIASRHLILGSPLTYATITQSTNDDAKREARRGAPHGALWLAESQTAGRGRHGRSWIGTHGESLLFSVLLRLACSPSHVPPIALACGLSVRDAVARALGPERDHEVCVKWPNDVLLGQKKVAGVLVESALAGASVEHVILGIGINVRTPTFPSDLADSATSLSLEGAANPDRAEILADVLQGLEHDALVVAYKGLGAIHERLSRRDALSGRPVQTAEGSIQGVAIGIDSSGRLLVRRDSGVITAITAGEVRLRPLG